MQKSSSCNFGGPGETKTPKNVSGNMQLPKCAFVEGKKFNMKKEEKILLFSSKLIFCRNSKKIARIKLNKTPVKLKMEKGKKKAFGLVLPFPCVCTVFGLPLPRKMSPANKNFRFDLEQEGVEERMLSFYRLGWRCFFEKKPGPFSLELLLGKTKTCRTPPAITYPKPVWQPCQNSQKLNCSSVQLQHSEINANNNNNNKII